LKAAFVDPRGSITDILDGVALNSVSRVTQKKGTVRGNHLHKKTVQYLYLLRGRLRYVTKKASRVMKAGDLAVSPPGEAHATVALADCEFLALSHGPRHGRAFESDTYRLAQPLVRPK
jgi:quercetin dioxygenase-like cupin family protein